MRPTDWPKYISLLLTKNDAFHLVKSECKGQTEIEIYSDQLENTFEVGYIDEHLIFLNISNPNIPGYNEHTKGEYFFADQFDMNRQSKVALEFDEINKQGIREIIENGLIGREEQFILNNNVIYCQLYINEYQTNVDLSNRTIWQKIFGPKIENMKGIMKKTIKLNEVFSGNK